MTGFNAKRFAFWRGSDIAARERLCRSAANAETENIFKRTLSLSRSKVDARRFLRECEDHTTWVNQVLKENDCVNPPSSLVEDLRKSVADGVTLVDIIEILTNEKPSGVFRHPVDRKEIVANIDLCLSILQSQGVSTAGIQSTDIADGSLKSSLSLISNIRKTFDPDFDDIPVGVEPVTYTSANPHGTAKIAVEVPHRGMLTTTRPVPQYRRELSYNSHSVNGEGHDLLPGSLSKEDVDVRQSAPDTIVSNTEFDTHGVSQYGMQYPRHQISDISSVPVKLQQGLIRPRSAKAAITVSSSPTSIEQPPPAMTNAWSGTHKVHVNGLSRVGQPGPATVEDRLKHLLTNSSSDVSKPSQANPYADGELLLPPAPTPRQTTLQGDGVENSTIIEDDGSYPGSAAIPDEGNHGNYAGERRSLNSVPSTSGYVPSVASDRWSGARRDVLANRNSVPLVQNGRQQYQPSPLTLAPSTNGHENYGFQPDSKPQVLATRSANQNVSQKSVGGGNDLRAAWTRLYGAQEGKPPAKPPQPPYRPQQSVFYKTGQKVVLSHKKGPPPPPPVRHESTVREGFTGHAIGTLGNHVGSYPAPMGQLTNQNGAGVVRQPIRQEERRSLNDGADVSDNFYPNEFPKSGTVTDDVKIENLQRTFGSCPDPFSDPHRENVFHRIENLNNVPQSRGTENVHVNNSHRVPSPTLVEKSGSYEELGIPNNHQESHQRERLQDCRSELTKPSKDLTFLSSLSSQVRKVTLTPPKSDQAKTNYADIGIDIDTPLAANDSIFDCRDSVSSGASSPSVTPPLPPLSPSNTPPMSPPTSPSPMPKFPRSLSADMLSTPKTPDLLTSMAGLNGASSRPHGDMKRVDSSQFNWNPYSPRDRSSPKKSASRRPRGFKYLHGVQESDDDSVPFDIDNTTLTVEQSPTVSQDKHQRTDTVADNVKHMQQKLDGLEEMYAEILRLVGIDKEFSGRERRHSIASSDTSSMRHARPFRQSGSQRPRTKDIRAVNKRFQRLESHVVTLARSVAHLSSEMKSQNSMLQEMDRLRLEVKELREVALCNHKTSKKQTPDFERFRGWVPALTNPKRINKLTKFFGQEPPLLELFLTRLGYDKYASNFKAEHIGMIELPYMTEERLRMIGIPMGPRLRILQEAQLCFRQENFDIYII